MWYLIEAVNVVFEIFIVLLFFSKLLIPRYERKYIYVVIYTAAAITLYISGILSSNATVLISVTFTILLVISSFLYKGTVNKRVFLSVLFIVIVFISEILFIGMMTALNIGQPNEFGEQGVSRIIGMVGTKIIYFWIVILVCKLLDKKLRDMPLKQWIMIISMPVISTMILYIIYCDLLKSVCGKNILIYCIAVAGLLYLNFAVFDFFETYQKQIRLTVLEQLVEVENTNYRLIEKSYDDMKKLKHDISNQISVIQNLIKHNDEKSANKVLNEISEIINNAGAVCYTGEPIIDSIINIKINKACEHGITVTSRINTDSFNIDTVEVCRILGNALDNAIEGCERSGISKPVIHISIREVDNKIAVAISNSSCDVDINDLHTSKSDSSIHGIGIESMKTSVKKLNGFMNQGYESGVFFFKMVLPNNQQ